jgi:formylglycine-generating enzyme required for sulfatase activity
MILDPLELVGTVVAEKYRFDDVVAEGGFSIIYRATHLVWQRSVAIKVFKALEALPADEQERLFQGFLQEGAILAELSERSAAICQARDTGTIVGTRGQRLPFLVLEWLEGAALDVILEDERRRGLPARTPRQTLDLLEPAMKALALAHASGVAHRDVKPANLFVVGDPRSEACRIKVLDFGIAKVVGEARRLAGFANTAPGPKVFTPVFAAPEQFSRTFGPTGPWTDVYGMALVLVETLTGRDAVEADTPQGALAIARDPSRRPTPRTLGVDLGDAVEQVFRRALAVRPTDRYAAADELLDALRAAIDLPPVSKLTDSVRSEPAISARIPSSATPAAGSFHVRVAPPARRVHHSALAGGLVGGAIALGFLGWALTSPHRRPEPVAATPPPPAPAPPPEPTCGAGMTRIPGGHFFMGSDDDLPLERPAHRVLLAPYCMDVHEVTTAEYRACSDRGNCKRAGTTNAWDKITAGDHAAFDPLCNTRDAEGRATHPVNCVDWAMAEGFCRVNGKRLPTEAEWEFAARGPDGRRYPWGTGDAILGATRRQPRSCSTPAARSA